MTRGMVISADIFAVLFCKISLGNLIIIVPTTYGNVSDHKLSFVDKMSSPTIQHMWNKVKILSLAINILIMLRLIHGASAGETKRSYIRALQCAMHLWDSTENHHGAP